MKMFSFLALAAVAVLPLSAYAGNGCATAAPAAASPAAAAPAVAQANNGYRSFSYQPAAAPAVYSNGYSNSYRRSNQPMWTNGANKALGRYN
ncbi:hypothetical protein [Anatilimnocola floriformis]|uniref:hypothetical protein n=1 Tax=Anatilimnocola floriformis TaxID=2948575 RepID=UPI0020C1DBAB|nr:hypothetical protein [Anatilimnocola floriformis]